MPYDAGLRAAPSLLQHPGTQDASAAALLDRLPLEEPAGARRILQTLSAHGSWSARLTAQLLEFLPLLSAAVAREVLPALPQIVGESDNEVRLLLEALKQLMSAERTLLLPVIGTLGEVQLPEALKPELAQLALGALPLADESDLPTLVRCLMHSLNAANASLVLRGLRQQLGALRAETLSLLLQVVCNTLRVSSSAVRALLRLCASAAELTRWDTLLLLLLLQLPRHAAAAAASLAGALRRGALADSVFGDAVVHGPLLGRAVRALPALSAALLAHSHPLVQRRGARLAEIIFASHPSVRRELLAQTIAATFSGGATGVAAARALGRFSASQPATLAGEWALLHESLAHAPRLPPSLFGALARCLAVAAREEPRLRPPLLVYVQKHLLAPPAAADDDAPAFGAAVLVSHALLAAGELPDTEACAILEWLVGALPLARGASATISWRLIARAVPRLPSHVLRALCACELPQALRATGLTVPSLATVPAPSVPTAATVAASAAAPVVRAMRSSAAAAACGCVWLGQLAARAEREPSRLALLRALLRCAFVCSKALRPSNAQASDCTSRTMPAAVTTSDVLLGLPTAADALQWGLGVPPTLAACERRMGLELLLPRSARPALEPEADYGGGEEDEEARDGEEEVVADGGDGGDAAGGGGEVTPEGVSLALARHCVCAVALIGEVVACAATRRDPLSHAMLRRLRDLFYLRKLGAACLQPMLGSASGADGAPAPPPATAAARAADERAREKSRVALISQLRSRLLSEALCEAGLRALLPCARTAGAAGGGPRLFGGLRLSLLSEWWARVQTHAAPLPLRGASPSFGVESDADDDGCSDDDEDAGVDEGTGGRGVCGSGSGFEKSARALEILTAWSEVLCVTCADARTRVAAAAGPRAAALEREWRADLHSLVLTYRLLATALSRAASHGSVTAVLARADALRATDDAAAGGAASACAAMRGTEMDTVVSAGATWADRLALQLELLPDAHLAAALLHVLELLPPPAATAGARWHGVRALCLLFPSSYADLARLLPPPALPTLPAAIATARAAAAAARCPLCSRHAALSSLVQRAFASAGAAHRLLLARALLAAADEVADPQLAIPGTIVASPAPRAAVPLLEAPTARAPLLLLLLPEIGAALHELRPAAPAALPAALLALTRATALGARTATVLREQLEPLSTAALAAGTSAICACAAALCVAVQEALHRCASCRCLPGCTLAPRVLAPAAALAAELLSTLRRLCAFLQRPPPIAAAAAAPATATADGRSHGQRPKMVAGARAVVRLPAAAPARRSGVQRGAGMPRDPDGSGSGSDSASGSDDETAVDQALSAPLVVEDTAPPNGARRGGAQLGPPRLLLRLEQLEQQLRELRGTHHIPDGVGGGDGYSDSRDGVAEGQAPGGGVAAQLWGRPPRGSAGRLLRALCASERRGAAAADDDEVRGRESDEEVFGGAQNLDGETSDDDIRADDGYSSWGSGDEAGERDDAEASDSDSGFSRRFIAKRRRLEDDDDDPGHTTTIVWRSRVE